MEEKVLQTPVTRQVSSENIETSQARRQIPVAPQTPPKPNISIKPKKRLKLVVVAVVVTILLGVVGLFVYRDYQSDQNQQSATASPLGEPLSDVSDDIINNSQTFSILTPTPTPVVFDILFDSPEFTIQQGYNDGSGRGWVIQDEFENGDDPIFDEIKKYWSSAISACFFGITNESLSGSDISYSIFVDDTKIREGNLQSFGIIKANETIKFCQDITSAIGKHNVKFMFNPDRTIPETDYSNNSAEIEYRVLADNVPPSFNIHEAISEEEGVCIWPENVSDNVTLYSDLVILQKMDDGEWEPYQWPRKCITGSIGEQHTYRVKITDERENTTEKSKIFSIF